MKNKFTLSASLVACANSKDGGETGFISACNSAPGEAITAGKWFKVSPFGEFDGGDAGMQYFGRPEAKRMVAEFNSLVSKVARFAKGLPIFIGHPDLDRQTYPDDRQLGKVRKLKVKSDGLYAQAAWNSLGEENLREGFWEYPSPFWIGPPTSGGFHPQRLISIGLTNTPRIVESAPLSAANAKVSADDLGTNQEKEMNREMLIEMLGLGADATEDEIKAALEALIENAANPAEETEVLEAANSKIANLKKEKKKLELSQANSLIGIAVLEGRISESERTTHLEAFEQDYQAAANSLASLKPVLNTKPLHVGKEKIKVANEKDRQIAVANAVKTVQAATGLGYKDAYARVKEDPEMAGVFEAMETGSAGE